jgi:hypothetical protein
MSAVQTDTKQLKSAYITTQAIERRRRSAMVELLGTFEKEIEPLLMPGHQATIDNFKGVVRRRINGLAYEGRRATETQPGESVSAMTTDLAADLAFDDTEGRD